MLRLSGKKALLTGASGDIGAATARRLAGEGVDLVLADRNPGPAKDLRKQLSALGRQIDVLVYDQRSPADVRQLVEKSIAILGHIDIVFANAGYARMVPFLSSTQEEWDRAMDINVSGLFALSQAVSKHMVDRRIHGSVVFTASVCGEHVGNQLTAYCTSKAATRMLMRCMATELGNFRIRCNSVSPGVIETGMTSGLLQDSRTAGMVRGTTPMGRWGTPDEVASVVSFLVSGDSSFVNGQDITVCGGQSNPLVPSWRPLNYEQEGEQDWSRASRADPDA